VPTGAYRSQDDSSEWEVEVVALVDRALDMLGASEPDTPPPGGMTFEQRAAMIGALYELRDRGRRPLHEWIYELRHVLSYSDATALLAKALPDPFDMGDMPGEKIESKISEIARLAVKIVETHPVAAFGGDVRHLLTQSVEGALMKSRPVRLMRLLLPTLGILFSGGLLWGAYQVDGIQNAARSARADINSAMTDINKEKSDVAVAASAAEAGIQSTATTANAQIGSLSASLLSSWNDRVRAESQAQLKELTDSVQAAKDSAKPKVQAELDGIGQWGKDRRADVQKAIDAQKDSLNALVPAIEAAKAQVVPQVEAQLRGITDWGTMKRDGLTSAATNMSTSIDAIGSTVEKLKSDAAIKTQATMSDVSVWGREQRAAIGTAIDTEKTTALRYLDAQKDAVKKEMDASLLDVQGRQSAVIKEMDVSLLDVQGQQSSVKTQLAFIVNDVRSGQDDIQKRLLETQNRQRDLDAKLASLQAFVDQSVHLQAVIERADSGGTLTFSTLVKVLEMKDVIAGIAGIVSIFAIALSGLALWRR
jgi:hypothetical protein